MIPTRSAMIAALASAVLAGTLTGCQFGEEQQNGDTIFIGVDLELTGSASSTGRAHQSALELKRDQINSSGILGNRKIQLKIKDNRSDPAESQRNVTSFANDSSITGIIMGGCNSCAVASSKIADDKRVPTIALAGADAVVNPVAARRYAFKLAPNAADTAAVLAAELQRQDVEKVALLHSKDEYGQEGLANLSNELNKRRIDLADAAATELNDADVDSKVTQLVRKKIDALVIWTPPGQAAVAAASARKGRRFTGPLFFDAGAAGELFMGQGGGQAFAESKMVFTPTMVIDDVIASTPAKAARKQWFRDYTARFGGYHGFSSFAADALQLFTDAVIRSGKTEGRPDRKGIRDVLETSQIDGLSGPIRMTPDNHSGLRAQGLTVLVARDGRWRLAG